MNFHFPENCQIPNLNMIYLSYFGYKEKGIFVEVGAYDGYNFSNTWGLAEAGWDGVYFEPVYDSYLQCVNNHQKHPKIIVINACLGDFEGEVEFNVAGTLSTYDQAHFKSKTWEHEYVDAKKIMVPVTTLNKILPENNIPSGFDLLIVDTEGSETNVLKGFDLGVWLPKMAIIEAHEHNVSRELSLQAPFINGYFKDFGYEKVYSDHINNIYVRMALLPSHLYKSKLVF